MTSKAQDRSVVPAVVMTKKKRKASTTASSARGKHDIPTEEEKVFSMHQPSDVVETTGDVFSGSVFTSLTEKHLNDCRITPSGQYDVIGVVANVCGCSRDQASQKIKEIKRGTSAGGLPLFTFSVRLENKIGKFQNERLFYFFHF